MKKRVAWVVLWAVITAVAMSAPAAEPASTPVKAAPVKAAKKQPQNLPRTPEDAVTPAVKNPERHEKFLARIKEGPVGLLFLGDSITDAWPKRGPESWQKFAPYHPADFGISGDRTEHVLWRITHGELEGIDPRVVVIMIGTNNVGHSSNEQPAWAANGVKKIVEIVHEKLPKAKVLLLGVFPRGAKDSDARQRVAAINPIIAQLDDGKRTRYLDIGKSFLDADGEIPTDVMADGLHPTAKGYDIWYDVMRPTLEQMMQP
jgi:lysophospholipase L1-like esterase